MLFCGLLGQPVVLRLLLVLDVLELLFFFLQLLHGRLEPRLESRQGLALKLIQHAPLELVCKRTSVVLDFARGRLRKGKAQCRAWLVELGQSAGWFIDFVLFFHGLVDQVVLGKFNHEVVLRRPPRLNLSQVHLGSEDVELAVKVLLDRRSATSELVRQEEVDGLVVFVGLVVFAKVFHHLFLELLVFGQLLGVFFVVLHHLLSVDFEALLGEAVVEVLVHLFFVVEPRLFQAWLGKREEVHVRHS